jgi:hypothetical protein
MGLQGTCWLLIGGLTLGLGIQGCLGRSSKGACFGKSVYRRRQRKAGMGGYLHMGPFILALDSFYGLTSNFSHPITCFEEIFLFITRLWSRASDLWWVATARRYWLQWTGTTTREMENDWGEKAGKDRHTGIVPRCSHMLFECTGCKEVHSGGRVLLVSFYSVNMVCPSWA